uniref:UBX domain-containing protein n=2 Tax=Rhinopithecus TaxID=542827 RepID=A0A2K6LVF6_RHIBE
FVVVTGTEEDQACFFLKSIVLASFYEDRGDEDIITISKATPSSVSRGTAPSNNRVTSFRDLIHDQDEDEEEERKQIVGPPRKKSPSELVDDLFKGAKEHGAVAVEGVSERPVHQDHLQEVAPEEESRQHSHQDVHVVLKLYKSGFSLDNGELRSYRDPSNAQFLESIHRGEVPAELWRLAHSGQANLDMEDHRDEDFMKSKGAFTGEGQKPSSTDPQGLSTISPVQPAENEDKANSSILIVKSETTTNIQIRLADGERLVNIQLFIADAWPAMAATSFILMTTFPNKELVDESWTLKEGNLLNAAIMQR